MTKILTYPVGGQLIDRKRGKVKNSSGWMNLNVSKSGRRFISIWWSAWGREIKVIVPMYVIKKFLMGAEFLKPNSLIQGDDMQRAKITGDPIVLKHILRKRKVYKDINKDINQAPQEEKG